MSSRQRPRRSHAICKKQRHQLGQFWLWYRVDRDDWAICWLDGRTTRRRSIGFGGGNQAQPPSEAQDALAKHYLSAQAQVALDLPDVPKSPSNVLLADITRQWLISHVAHLHAGERYAASVLTLQRFYDEMRAQGHLTGPLMISGVTRHLVSAFIEWRAAEGASTATISRDLAAIRGPINWALKEQVISSAPRIAEVKGKSRRKELEYSTEQIAAILDAAWASSERHHVHLYMLIHLSTHGRSEAILELKSDQVRDGLIFFNAAGRQQTRKRRSVVPIAPTLTPWLQGIKGKVIKYRAATSEKTRSSGGPAYFERDTYDVGRAFEACLVAAHLANPALMLARQAVGPAGDLLWLPARKKLGETVARPKLVGVGTPNTLRHTIHTWHQRRGVPQAQIDAAAGHSSERGSGANYTHLRPKYLDSFIASTEAFWADVGQYTQAHIRYQRDTKPIVSQIQRNPVTLQDYGFKWKSVVELSGIEPLASAVRLQRSPI